MRDLMNRRFANPRGLPYVLSIALYFVRLDAISDTIGKISAVVDRSRSSDVS